MTGKPFLSLCMIVRDEEENLPLSLGPVARCFDEAVVVDTGSRDGTVGLARSLGARVVSIKWPDDFSAARNASIRAASGDWIMWLDADNRIKAEDVDTLRGFLDLKREAVLWCIEEVIPEGERLIQKRVFPRRSDVFFTGRVHEQLVHPLDFRSIMTPVVIAHWGYADKGAARQKGQRNLALLETMIQENPDDFYVRYQMGRTLYNLRRFREAADLLDGVGISENGDLNHGISRHARVLLSQALDRSGEPQRAEGVLVELTARAPHYGPGHFYLARLSYSKNEYAKACRHFAKFLELGAGDPIAGLNPTRLRFMAHLLLGRCLEHMGRPDAAAESYQAASEIDPGHPEPYLALAGLARDQGLTTEYRHHLGQCLNVAPGNRRALSLLKEAANVDLR